MYLCGVGQKASSVASVVRKLKLYGAHDRANASDPAAMVFGTLCWGMMVSITALRDALIIYDDLSKQAVAYRQISLFAPTSRRGIPGCVHLHSRL